jgi:hypothetical protein
MGIANGLVKFSDGTIKHFVFDGSADVCIPRLYDTYEKMTENWRMFNGKPISCNHVKEPVEMCTDYGDFYWQGTACRKCMMILEGEDPFEQKYQKGIPEWFEKYYED